MGDGTMHEGARARLVGGLVMLTVPVTVGLAVLVRRLFVTDLVVLEYLDNWVLVGVVVAAFTVGALPLLVPQRVPPPDIRHNRWYMSVGMCLTALQGVLLVDPVLPHEILDQTTDGERSVVLYHPGTGRACIRIWQGYGAAAVVVGDIGRPGRYTQGFFRDDHTVVLSPEPVTGNRAFRLHPRTGRPLDTTEPCVRRSR